MRYLISQENFKSDFIRLVEEESGQTLSKCYQCGKCSSGCPLAYKMELLPNQVIRMIQLGMRENVLQSNTMWFCASCETCSTRCPRAIDVKGIMDALRIISYKEDLKSSEKDLQLFNKVFLDNIKSKGRLWELGFILSLNSRLLKPFKDVSKAPKLFLNGKIALFGKKILKRKELDEIFEKALSFSSPNTRLGDKHEGQGDAK